jgi:hypothetical protein
VPRNLVAAVAERLMEATASTAAQRANRCWLSSSSNSRRTPASCAANDHGLRASVLVQARIAAEERLQCLVEHDDLTALHNRRGSYCVPL